MGTTEPRPVYVRWLDSWAEHDQQPISEAFENHTDPTIETVGYLVAEDKGWVFVARDILDAGASRDCRCVIRIPRKMVEEIRDLA